MRFNISKILILLCLSACTRHLSSEPSCNFVENPQNRRLSWDKRFPIDLYLDSSVPYIYTNDIQVAVNTWNKIGQNITGQDFFHLHVSSPGAPYPAQDGYSKIYFVSNWTKSSAIEATTTIRWNGSTIYEADMMINAQNYQFMPGDISNPGKLNLKSLVIHELGHVLGLAHNQDSRSVMQPTLANGQLRYVINEIDANSLQCGYN